MFALSPRALFHGIPMHFRAHFEGPVLRLHYFARCHVKATSQWLSCSWVVYHALFHAAILVLRFVAKLLHTNFRARFHDSEYQSKYLRCGPMLAFKESPFLCPFLGSFTCSHSCARFRSKTFWHEFSCSVSRYLILPLIVMLSYAWSVVSTGGMRTDRLKGPEIGKTC